MTPSLVTVMRLRYFVRVGVRLLGVALIVASLAAAAGLVMQGAAQIITGQGVQMVYATAGIMSTFGPGVTGLVLIMLAARIARWAIPIPTHRCPQCDYPLAGVTQGSCPECGLVTGQQPAQDVRRVNSRPTPRTAT